MLTLLGKPSSINVRKVLWLLDELALPFTLQPHGSGFAPTDTPAFKALNPNALVPVLIDDGAVDAAGQPLPQPLVLWESNTLCRYLAGRAQRHDLLPASPTERARVEQWMDWQATELNTAWRYAFMALVRRSPLHQDPAQLAASVADWNGRMRILEAQLAKTGAFVAGATFTLADVVLGLSAERWRMCPMDREALPAVDAWHARLCERPAFLRHGHNGMP